MEGGTSLMMSDRKHSPTGVSGEEKTTAPLESELGLGS